MAKIISIKAREILDSRGKPTVKAEVETSWGIFFASVPSGVSRGKYEAVSLPAQEAVKSIEEVIGPKLVGKDISDPKKIDKTLIELDGTENKSRLGANALLAVSIACCRALAKASNLPLHSYISQIYNVPNATTFGTLPLLPRPMVLCLEGGRHSKSGLGIQEFMIVPLVDKFYRGEKSQQIGFKKSLEAGVTIYGKLGEILREEFGEKGVVLGDEGGFAPGLKNTEEALHLFVRVIEKSGFHDKVAIALDVAASEFFSPSVIPRPSQPPQAGGEAEESHGQYNFEGKSLTTEELLDFYQKLIKKYPIISLEDPFSQDDWEGWRRISSKFKVQSSKLLIAGDDLTTTNPQRMKMAHKKRTCNGGVIKPNQIGTVSETIGAAKLAKKFGWQVIVSHRAAETADDFIADLAVGIGADFIKSGAPAQPERMAKYTRLLEIEKELL